MFRSLVTGTSGVHLVAGAIVVQQRATLLYGGNGSTGATVVPGAIVHLVWEGRMLRVAYLLSGQMGHTGQLVDGISQAPAGHCRQVLTQYIHICQTHP